MRELDEILASRNDNDPRLDTDFRGLTEREKSALRERYRKLPLEKLNERGTIVLLLGREASTPADWSFLRLVAGGHPCLSLGDCLKSAPGPPSPGDEVTLAYPNLVAVKAAERRLEKDPRDSFARKVIDAGMSCTSPAVVRLSRRVWSRLPRR